MAGEPGSQESREPQPVGRVQRWGSRIFRHLPLGRFSERFQLFGPVTPLVFDPSLPPEELGRQYRDQIIQLEVARYGIPTKVGQKKRKEGITKIFGQAVTRLFEPAYQVDVLRTHVLEDVTKYAREDSKQVKGMALAFIRQHSVSIEEIMEKTDPHDQLARAAFDAVREMLGGNEQQQSYALQVLQSHQDRIFGLLGNEVIANFFGCELAGVMESKNPVLVRSANQIIEAIIQGKFERGSKYQDFTNGSAFLGGLLYEYYKKAHRYGQDTLFPMLKEAGLDPLETVQKWQMGKHINSSNGAVAKNLPLLLELNREHPGSVGLLSQNYHLFNLGRYPKAVLEEMVQTHEDASLPAFYVIYPRSDDEIFGQFYNQKFVLDKLYTQLKGRVRIKIVEVETDKEIEEMLDSLKGRFGQGKAGILAGHGSKDAITFGKEGDGHQLTTQHFLSGNVDHGAGRALKEAFVPGATLALFSCSTGFDDPEGIARVIKETTGINTLGPDRPTSISNIEADVDDTGNVDLDVYYYKALTKKYS